MYIRTKKIKGKEYAYLVQSRWKKRNKNSKNGPRQKVKGYLGRVYRLESKKDIDFFEFLSIKDSDKYLIKSCKKKIVYDLIRWEIYKHEISKDDFLIDIEDKKIMKNEKSVVLGINDGYLCGETIKKLINFKNGEEEQQGLELAKRFVQAGINIPNELFICYFEKINGL